MSLGFGVSINNFSSGFSLIGDLIKTIEDAAGAREEFKNLIRELYSLERSLIEVKHVNIDPSLQFQKNAVEQAACQFQETISIFVSKLEKFRPSFTFSKSSNVVNHMFRQVQWLLCKTDDIDKFRAQIAGHSSSIRTLLATLQLLVAFELLDQTN